MVAGSVIHIRYCSPSSSGNAHFAFNINPNTLTAENELWICGDVETYYLIPTPVLRQVYEHPDTYTDSRHPEIRVVSVDISRDKMTYAVGGQSLDIAMYFNRSLV
jgi:hypothetical protein